MADDEHETDREQVVLDKSGRRDPRRPDAVVPFKLERVAPEQAPFDVWGLAAIALGIACLLARSKYAGWAALFACVISMANTKNSEADGKQTSTSLMFAVMGLFMNYFTVRPKGALF